MAMRHDSLEGSVGNPPRSSGDGTIVATRQCRRICGNPCPMAHGRSTTLGATPTRRPSESHRPGATLSRSIAGGRIHRPSTPARHSTASSRNGAAVRRTDPTIGGTTTTTTTTIVVVIFAPCELEIGTIGGAAMVSNHPSSAVAVDLVDPDSLGLEASHSHGTAAATTTRTRTTSGWIVVVVTAVIIPTTGLIDYLVVTLPHTTG
mmetsp:Transcript_18499/g.43687  ORF Transcript_18499/g.43687 Transcript_18499/m.43687 type:complete len:205 (+) Transcript_18499:606-1220(+)